MQTSDEKIVEDLRKGTLTESEVYEILNQRVEGLEMVCDISTENHGWFKFVFREEGQTAPMYSILYTISSAYLIDEMVFQGEVKPTISAKVSVNYVPKSSDIGHGTVTIGKHIADRRDLGVKLAELLKDVDFDF